MSWWRAIFVGLVCPGRQCCQMLAPGFHTPQRQWDGEGVFCWLSAAPFQVSYLFPVPSEDVVTPKSGSSRLARVKWDHSDSMGWCGIS